MDTLSIALISSLLGTWALCSSILIIIGLFDKAGISDWDDLKKALRRRKKRRQNKKKEKQNE